MSVLIINNSIKNKNFIQIRNICCSNSPILFVTMQINRIGYIFSECHYIKPINKICTQTYLPLSFIYIKSAISYITTLLKPSNLAILQAIHSDSHSYISSPFLPNDDYFNQKILLSLSITCHFNNSPSDEELDISLRILTLPKRS